MSKTLLTSILFLFCLDNLNAQNIGANKVTVPDQLLKFIPKGYALLDTAMGDLNLDKFQDVILILKIIGEDTGLEATEYKRPLLILLANAGNTFSLVARNDNVVYCFQCGGLFGDPYDGVEIKKGSFTVHVGGSANISGNLPGHFSIKTTERYLHVKRETLINIPNVLDDLNKNFTLDW